MTAERLEPGPRGLRGFARALAGDRPRRLAWVIVVLVCAGLGQALGVLLLVPLLGAVGVHASSGTSRWMRGAFNSVGIAPTLTNVLAVYVVVTGATAALSAYQTVLSTRYQLEFVDGLRGRLHAAVGRAEWRHLMAVRQSDVLAVLTTNVAFVGIGSLGALNVVVASVVVGAQLAAAARVSPVMTGLAVASGLVLVAVVWPLVRRSRRLGAELVERLRGVMAHATAFLDALKLAKAYSREDQHVSAFTGALAEVRQSQIGVARAAGMANAVQLTLTALLLAVVVDLGVRDLHEPVGASLVVAFVFTRVISQVTSAQSSIQQVAMALPAFDEVMELIESCEQAREVPVVAGRQRRVTIGDGVRLKGVHFAYSRGAGERVDALRGVSLELPAGSMVALTGPSGSGKTTVADIIAGLITPDAGQVFVGERPLTPERTLGWRASIALVPQDPFLFHDTVAGNLRWARPDATNSDIRQALELAAADRFVELLPRGLNTVVGERGMRLSGGERQRLALARALLRRPELLILDEATSSLDTENERVIRTALAALRGQTTILVIAHRLSTASEADQIVVLDSGRVVEAGSWSELAQTPMGRLQSLIEAGHSAIA